MTDEKPRPNGDEASRLLSDAREHYDTMRWLIQDRINQLRSDGERSEADIRKLVAGYAQAVQLLLTEIRKVDKEHATQPGEGGGAFDLDAVRAEIGGRLARLRAARDAGGVPE